jgi:hypothetical protein
MIGFRLIIDKGEVGLQQFGSDSKLNEIALLIAEMERLKLAYLSMFPKPNVIAKAKFDGVQP